MLRVAALLRRHCVSATATPRSLGALCSCSRYRTAGPDRDGGLGGGPGGGRRQHDSGRCHWRHTGADSRFIVFAEPLPQVGKTVTLLPVEAPWHPDGAASELTGAKTLSYGPNVAARFHAKKEGYGDALLVGRSGNVLEGPTNTVAWITDGVFETPELSLGILASVTRQAVLDVASHIGVPVNEGSFPLQRMVDADEVVALSTLREVQPVVRVGDVEKEVGPITRQLIAGLHDLIVEETTQ